MPNTLEVMHSNLAGVKPATFRLGGWGGVILKQVLTALHIRASDDGSFGDLMARFVGLNDSGGKTIVLGAPTGLAASARYDWPGSPPSALQFLQIASVSGAGDNTVITLQGADAQANAPLTQRTDFTQATTSPASIFTPPANYTLDRVYVKVASAAASGTPTLSVGNATDQEAYMTAAQVDLKRAGLYIVELGLDVGASPVPINVYLTVGGAPAFSGYVALVYSKPF